MGFTFKYLPGKFASSDIHALIQNIDSIEGEVIGDGNRNRIKLVMLNNEPVNIKSYKIPAVINQIAYRYFRKSKAQRSFEYAQILLEKGIGTPQPIAFYEQYTPLGLTKSYYVSEHLYYDLTFRELITIPNFPDHENILRQFAHFCFELHEKGIEFLDHSPGNTLIKKGNEGKYTFYLVDLNRMRFRTSMSFDERMQNLQRLTTKKEVIRVMSSEYAKWYQKPEEEVFNMLWYKATTFAKSFTRKKMFTNKLKTYRQFLPVFFFSIASWNFGLD